MNRNAENRKSQSHVSGLAFSRREEKRYFYYCISCATRDNKKHLIILGSSINSIPSHGHRNSDKIKKIILFRIKISPNLPCAPNQLVFMVALITASTCRQNDGFMQSIHTLFPVGQKHDHPPPFIPAQSKLSEAGP